MEASNMKNMVVLKNLPSNIVDEAIIILKNGKKVKKSTEVPSDMLLLLSEALFDNSAAMWLYEVVCISLSI